VEKEKDKGKDSVWAQQTTFGPSHLPLYAAQLLHLTPTYGAHRAAALALRPLMDWARSPVGRARVRLFASHYHVGSACQETPL
jgi:hypothetical protein